MRGVLVAPLTVGLLVLGLVSPAAAEPVASAAASASPADPTGCPADNVALLATGTQRAWTTPLAPSTTLDARGAAWTRVGDYALTFSGSGRDACIEGGSVVGEWPDTDAWTKWHYRTAIRFSQPGFTVAGVHLVNQGDGVKPKDDRGGQAQDFVIEGSWIEHMHDDCVENDYLHAGVIRDNLFDGCYVMFSSRPSSSRYDGRKNVVFVAGNVGFLGPTQTVYSGTSPGTGGFFKWSAKAPVMVVIDNVFLAVQAPNHGTLDPPTGPMLCGRNVIVWAGKGAFPSLSAWMDRCPDTVVTTDVSQFFGARAAWLTAHPSIG